MKKILLILFLLTVLIGARAQQIITATITVTNIAGTTNGQTLTINSLTRTWTNTFTVPLTQILTATNNYQSGTNLFQSYIESPFPNTSLQFNGSNAIALQTYPGGAMVVSLSSGWGTVSYVTNTIGTTVYELRAPFSVATPVEKTNIETALPNYLNDNLGSTTVGTNAPTFSPWYTWISGLWSSLNGSLTNFNGTNIQSGTITTNSLDTQIFNLLFSGSPVSSVFIPGLELQYEAGTNSSGGAFGTGFTNWVTTNQSQTLFGPVTVSNSHAAPFWNLTRNYDGAVLASMDAEGVWDFVAGNFSQLTVNNIPVGSGGSGTNGTSGAVGSLNYVNFSNKSQNSGYISNVVMANFSAGTLLNGTYTNNPAYGYQDYIYGGQYFRQWYRYDSTVSPGCFFTMVNPSPIYYYTYWFMYNNNGVFGYFNGSTLLVAPTFSSTWHPYVPDGYVPSMTPSFSNVSTSVTNSTVFWGLGDNWYFSITASSNLILSLAQDWEATNTLQVEKHKIFLNSVSNSMTLSFAQTTNQWFWENRQGLAAAAPTSLSSNETMTIDITHIGGQTNWLATWDTTVATNIAMGGGGLSVTNWTTLSASTTTFTTNVVYTCTNGPALFIGNSMTASANEDVFIYYTNNGVGYFQSALTYTVPQVPFSFPLISGSTFCFQVGNGTTPLTITNAQIWQLPH